MILIDKSVGSVELLEYFPLSELGTKCKLDSADVAFTGNGPDNQILSIGIELKSLSDFIDSIRTGRLHGRQTRLMLSTYDVSYLAIYGVYKCDPETGYLLTQRGREWKPYRQSPAGEPLQYSFIESCVFSAEAIGIRVRMLPLSHYKHQMAQTRMHLAMWFYCLYSWWSKPWDQHRSIKTLDNSRQIVRTTTNLQTMGLTDKQLLTANIAAQIPGLRGYERPLAIARAFRSPIEFLNASADDIAEIVVVSEKGRRVRIGSVIAGRIRAALDGRNSTKNAETAAANKKRNSIR